MDSMAAFAMGYANRGKEQMVFDWVKAAEIIRDENPETASAGLEGDWSCTAGTIFENGEIEEEYTYHMQMAQGSSLLSLIA